MSNLGIQASGLEKKFTLGHANTAKLAVADVSFSIREGERVGFIGRNGAGKSTLLQMLAGITAPTSGTLDVQGHVTAIFTLGLGLRDDLTGLENILVEGELLGRTREATLALVDDIVAFADLGPFIDRPVRTYSTGMKARLAFSTIVHVEPEILVIDEALSVGDARFAAKATAKMRELAARGRILILVSHSMRAIESMCTRCIWLDEGRIRMDGLPAEVTGAYLDEVRSEDEAGVLARLRRKLAPEQLLEGWSIDSLQLNGGESLAVNTVWTGDPGWFSLGVRGPEGSSFRASLALTRLDGLEVLKSCGGTDAEFIALGARGERTIRVDMGLTPLNQGIYRAQFEILAAGGPAARRSILFEVRNPRPHRGGQPVLVYPTTFSASPVSNDLPRI